jgi:hypothetical protein
VLQFLNSEFTEPSARIAAPWPEQSLRTLRKYPMQPTWNESVGLHILNFWMVGIPKATGDAAGLGRLVPLILAKS